MRFHIATLTQIVFLVVFTLGAQAAETQKPVVASTAEMKILLEKYEAVMDQQQVELIDEVFTKAFISSQGGKEEFTALVKSLPYVKKKSGLGLLFQKFKKSKVGQFFTLKAKSKGKAEPEFIVKEEDGKLKIDGTIGDG